MPGPFKQLPTNDRSMMVLVPWVIFKFKQISLFMKVFFVVNFFVMLTTYALSGFGVTDYFSPDFKELNKALFGFSTIFHFVYGAYVTFRYDIFAKKVTNTEE